MIQSFKHKNILKNISNIIRRSKNANIIMVLIIMIIIPSVFSPYFLTFYNITSIIRDAAFIGLVTLGQACLLITGELDLSVGSIAALCGVFGGIFMANTPINPFVAFVLILILGAFLGFLNGTIITRLNLSSLIVTIGMSGVYLGINLVITKGRAVLGIPESIYFLGQAKLLGMPMPFVIMIIVMVVVVFFTKYTRIGRYMYAIGNNREAANILGIDVNMVRTFVFSLAGALSALAGMLVVARLGTAQPGIATDWPLNSIAASVIGGVSLIGGVGNPFGAIMGVGIIVIIQNIIVLFGVSPYLQTTVSGIVVVIAISFDSISHMMQSRRKQKSKEIL
jgi:ribose transport system permease protein